MEIETDFGSRKVLPSDNLSLLSRIFMAAVSIFTSKIYNALAGQFPLYGLANIIHHHKIGISFQIEISLYRVALIL